MAQLNSPGVVVTVVDESFYTPAAPSTVPLIVIATEENKPNGSNTGIAPGTLKSNAGLAYLITSQRDLSETFGIASFKTDSNNNPIHAGEQNEYGLHAAYSYLGVSNRAYVVRADIDLGSINARAFVPKDNAANNTYWLDTGNSDWGVFEWNGDPKGTGKGQTFTKKFPIIITDTKKVVDYAAGDYTPKASVGAIGDYALVSLMNLDTTYDEPDVLWFKSPGNLFSVSPGEWVKVGSQEWKDSWPVVVSRNADISAADTKTLVFDANGLPGNETMIINGTDAQTIAAQINSFSTTVKASVTKNDRLTLHCSSSITSFTIGGTALADLGIDAKTYREPRVSIQPHTSVPTYKSSDQTPRPTGSLWIKTTEPGGGAKLVLKKYNADSFAWEIVAAPIHRSQQDAIFALDKTGGLRIPTGSIFVKYNTEEDYNTQSGPIVHNIVDFEIFRRRSAGATTVNSVKILSEVRDSNNLIIQSSTFSPGDIVDINVEESVAGGNGFLPAATQVTCTLSGDSSDADLIAGVINNAGLINISAEVTSQNRVVIRHKLGGEIRLQDNSSFNFLEVFFGSETNPDLYDAPLSNVNDKLISLWEPLRFTSSNTAPVSLTANNTLWYSSIIDEVDIMVQTNNKWQGYRNAYPGTDPFGPIVSPSRPVTQKDGVTPLVTNDLWIDSGDIDNYPMIYRFDNTKLGPISTRWVPVDKTDQSTEDGIVFADARWSTAGEDQEPAEISKLLLSDHVDHDSPDPALYPRGMLLWNMRRSGFNVKKFVQNYINIDENNLRIELLDNNGDPYNPLMSNYYPHRWVTVSGNNQDGSGKFGRLAQRSVVVQSLQAVVNSSRDIREEARVFNLSSCPGYPELIGELINLNFDRGLTAFIVGDTPARLTPDATSLENWGNNLSLAFEDNDKGAASYDEYMGMFYPWGLTSDNFGRNIVVPPSHMMLRTIALSDSVSYPWFAPAGTRRGGITNASSVGYVDNEGEFVVIALNTGQRDTLYDVKINPITFFTGVGLVNFGQKTRAKAASALDRINVARLVIYLRRQLDILAKPYIFEPNDKITRDELKGAVESLMLELVGQRALYDYIVVCDESNNTPSRIDRNELWVDIAIEPVKAVEFIYIPLRLKNTGEIGQL